MLGPNSGGGRTERVTLPQHSMIRKVEELCRADPSIRAALQYGSFTQGEGDAWSDIEFWLFVDDLALAGLDGRVWVARVAPVLLFVQNEFGAGVAIFENLVRGEFHFAAASSLPQIREWPLSEERPDIDAMIVLDRGGELREHLTAMLAAPSSRLTTARLQSLQDRFLNWFLFGLNLLARGEAARALDVLSSVQRHLLWLARIAEGSAERHFLTPSRRAESDLEPASYGRYAETSARLEAADLARAYRAAWRWYGELAGSLADEFGTTPRKLLMQRLGERVANVLTQE